MPRPNPLFPASAVAVLDSLRAQKRVDVCRVRRRTIEDLPDGTQTVVWAPPGDPVPCRVEAEDRTVQEGATGFRVEDREELVVRMPRDTEVDQDDRIVHQDSGLTFDVRNSPGVPSIGLETICRCVVTDLPQED